MTKVKVKIARGVAAFAAVVLFGVTAHAVSVVVRINTPGTACEFMNGGEAWTSTSAHPWVLKRYTSGGVSNPDSRPHDIVCPIGTGVIDAVFNNSLYVDGNNSAFSITACTVYQYDFHGTLLASSSAGFPQTLATFDEPMGFNTADPFDYYVLDCNLYGGNTSMIRGVTFFQ